MKARDQSAADPAFEQSYGGVWSPYEDEPTKLCRAVLPAAMMKRAHSESGLLYIVK